MTTEEIAELESAIGGARTLSQETPGGSPPPAETQKPAEAAQAAKPAEEAAKPAATAETKPAAEAAKPASEAKPAAETAKPIDFTQHLGGKYKSFDEVQAEINRIKDLEVKLDDAVKNPKFASERAKMLYNYANRIETMDGVEALQSFLHVQKVAGQLDKLPDQQLRFEAFKLLPEYQGKGLSDDDLKVVFLDEEINKFGNPEDTQNPPSPAQIMRAKLATDAAKTTIKALQQEFDKAKPAVETPADVVAERLRLRTEAEAALSDFKGIQFPVTATGENGEKLESTFNFAVDKPEQLKAILDGAVSPQEMWEQVLAAKGAISADGKVDMAKFGRVVANFLFHDEQLNEAYRQGHGDGYGYKVKVTRNAAPPPEGGAPPAGGGQPKNDQEGLAEAAMKASGFKTI